MGSSSFTTIQSPTIWGGASNNAVNPTSYTIESPDITLQPATRTGYTFNKWTSDDQDITTIPNGTAGNLTLTANWTINQYTLSFDTAGGSTINAITQNYSSDITAPSNPTKTGYTFANWDKTIPSKMPAENQTFTASWTANTYSVAFNPNGGTGTMSNQSFTYDETAKALTTNTFTRTGYTFSGWNTQANGSGTSYTDGQSVQNLTSTANATITLYAQWTIQNYTITYDLDGGTVATANPSSYNVESSAITLNNPTKTGYTFAGWTGSNGTTPATTITIAKDSTGNRNYKANWTINKYTLTFITNGGTTIEAITQDYNTSVTAPANPTKNGYTFTAWDKTIPARMPAENMTFTASWTIINYTISYDLDGGTVTDNPTSYNIESSAITLNNPTKTSHDFTGWTGTDLTETTKNVTIAAGSTGNRSYKATYIKIEDPAPTPTPDPSATTLTKLNVTLSADKNSLTLNAGSEDKIVFTVEVSGDYSDNSTKILASNDYEISWDISPDIIGITIADGVLNVSSDSKVGSHDLTILATVGNGNITASADKLITIEIIQVKIPETSPYISPDVSQDISPDVSPDTSPDLSPDVTITPQDILAMDTEEIEKTFGGGTSLTLTGTMTNEELQEVIEKVTSVTTVTTLDLSKVEDVEEVKIDSAASFDTLIIVGNTSIKTVEVTGNSAIKTLDVTGSKVKGL